MVMRLLLGLVGLCLLPTPVLFAQSLDEKVAKLRECARVPTDPDADKRFIGLQEILKGGDPDCKERAIKAALTVSDPKLQSVALAGFLTSFGSISLAIVPPANIRDLAAAALRDPQKYNELHNKNSFFARLQRTYQGTLRLRFVDDGRSKYKTTVLVGGDPTDDRVYGEAFLRGTTVYGRVPQIANRSPVDFEIRLAANGKITGKASFGNAGSADLEGAMYP